MFTNVRYFVKTSIAFMVVEILSGFYMMISRRLFDSGNRPSMLSAHTRIILAGFMMIIIMGIAVWFFPKADKGYKRYGSALITVVYRLMVTGKSVRFILR